MLQKFAFMSLYVFFQTYREFQRLSEGLGFRVFYIDKVGKDTAKLKAASKKIGELQHHEMRS